MTYSVNNSLERIDTAFIKRARWRGFVHTAASVTAATKSTPIVICSSTSWIFPAYAKTFTLPNVPNLRVIAATAAFDDHDATQPAQPLYDDFNNRKPIQLPDGWATLK